VNPQTRIKLIRDRMRYGEKYSVSQLYMIYTDIMAIDYYVQNSTKRSEETLRRQLRVVAKYDSWLGKDGSLYFKVEPQCVFSKLHEQLINLWKRIEQWAK
jgi:hypothetical protein